MTTTPILSLQTISKIYGSDPGRAQEMRAQGTDRDTIQEQTGQIVALEDISLDIPGGRTTVIMGLSGSGKSTLVRIVNRLIDPTGGRVLLEGDDLTALSRRDLIAVRRRRMAMVFQHFALLPHRSVLHNVAYGLQIQGVGRQERQETAARWITQVGLEGYERVRPHELSGGMRQRVGLARALASNADILLMDEPFSALDPLIRHDMQDLLLTLQREHRRTIVFITHDLDEALRLGDQIAILNQGRLVEVGTPSELLLKPTPGYVERFMRDANRLRALTAGDVAGAAPVVLTDTEQPLAALRRMKQAETTKAVVTDAQQRPLGMVSDDDLRAATGPEHKSIGGFTRPVPILDPGMSLEDAIPLIDAQDHALPVARTGLSGAQGPLVGVLGRDTLLRALISSR